MKLNKMRRQIIDSFVNSLKEDTIPWHKSWSTVNGTPYNAATQAGYHGLNAFWLAYTAAEKGYNDPRWCTYNQAQDRGWQVKKGEKGTKIEFWSLYDTEEKKKITQEAAKKLQKQLSPEEFMKRIKMLSNIYVVFNAAQIEGIPELELHTYKLNTDELATCRDRIIQNMDVKFKENGYQAFYNPSIDEINMPAMELFEDEYAYMSTFLHESAHATGAEKRLNREIENSFGTPEYAREELRAEIASAFTAQITGINYQQNDFMENHKAYIQNWIEVLEKNPNELFAAIKDAEKISDYLIEKGEFENIRTQENQIIEEKENEILNNNTVELVKEYVDKGYLKIDDVNNVDIDKLKGIITRLQNNALEDDFNGEGNCMIVNVNSKAIIDLSTAEEFVIINGNEDITQITTVKYYDGDKYENSFETNEFNLWNLEKKISKEFLQKFFVGKNILLYGDMEKIDFNEFRVAIKDVENISDYLRKKGEFARKIHNAIEENKEEFEFEHDIFRVSEAIENGNIQYSGDNIRQETVNKYDGINYKRILSEEEQNTPDAETPEESAVFWREQRIINDIAFESAKKDLMDSTYSLASSGHSYEELCSWIPNINDEENRDGLNKLLHSDLKDNQKQFIEAVYDLYMFDCSPDNVYLIVREKYEEAVLVKEMHDYGYTWNGMLPVSKEKAAELMNNMPVYKLYQDNTEAMIDYVSEIDNFDGMLGVNKKDYERFQEKDSELSEKIEKITDFEQRFGIPEELRITQSAISEQDIEQRFNEVTKIMKRYNDIENVKIGNLAVDEDNYLHFSAQVDGYELEGLFRIHDMQNGRDMSLVSIDYGDRHEIIREQWDNIENFCKEFCNNKYEQIERENMPLFSNQEAAQIRLAIKGREKSLDVIKNNKAEDFEQIKLAYSVGKEVKDYMDAGISIEKVIEEKTYIIDSKLEIRNPNYTKNIISSVYSHGMDEYMDLNAITLESGEKNNYINVSKRLAEKLHDLDIDLYTRKYGNMRVIPNRLQLEHTDSENIYADKTKYEHRAEVFQDVYPVITCRLTEHPDFVSDRTYMVSEFNEKMEQSDKEWCEGFKEALSRYDSEEDLYNTDIPEDRRYLGYAKTDYIIKTNNRTFEDRQDIGDGFGGVISNLKSMNDNNQHDDLISELENAVKAEEEFMSFQDKLVKVYEYEQEQGFSNDIRATTEDMEVLSKEQIDTSFKYLDRQNRLPAEKNMSDTHKYILNARKMMVFER